MNKQELIKEILSDMVYDETIRNGIWKHQTDTYQDFYHHAHGDMLPDDHRYKMIHDILCAMSEYDDLEDINSLEMLDSLVPVYTNDLLQWVSSLGSRYTYVDESVEEYGHSEQGFTGDLMQGYLCELQEVYDLISEWLNDNIVEDE